MEKILVIEDRDTTRATILQTLKFGGFEPIGAATGEEGVGLARKHHPSLILCDLRMPGMDGFDTLNEVRSHDDTAATPFIFLTGEAQDGDLRRGMQLGADDFLEKPFSPNELYEAIRARLSRLEKANQKWQRRLDEFRDAISKALPHELRTSLSGILGLTELMIDGSNEMEPEQVQDLLMDTQTMAKRLERVCDNFWHFSQLELLETAAEIPCETTRLGQLIEPTAREVAEQMGRSDDLTVEVAPDVVTIPGRHLKKICRELVDNAFRFSVPGDQVRVAVEAENGKLVLVVADQGCGMSEGQIAAIGPYVQHERDVREQPGVGLGLYLAKRLTELHGGEFRVDSVVGGGATMRATLPT